jgi:hypothetical protein
MRRSLSESELIIAGREWEWRVASNSRICTHPSARTPQLAPKPYKNHPCSGKPTRLANTVGLHKRQPETPHAGGLGQQCAVRAVREVCETLVPGFEDGLSELAQPATGEQTAHQIHVTLTQVPTDACHSSAARRARRGRARCRARCRASCPWAPSDARCAQETSRAPPYRQAPDLSLVCSSDGRQLGGSRRSGRAASTAARYAKRGGALASSSFCLTSPARV